MIQLSRWKIIVLVASLLFGLLFTFPNLLTQEQRDALPGWLPKNTLNLGLDLQGGSYLLLEVDVPEMQRARIDNLVEDTRVTLNEAQVQISGLQRESNGVVISLANAGQIDAGLRALRDTVRAAGPSGQAERTVSRLSGDRIRFAYTDAAMAAMGPTAVDQSIEVVRRRIDSLGTREPSITRQGADRIVVQAPGESDPSQLERVIGQTAQLTFQMVDHENSVQEALAGAVPPDAVLMTDEFGQPLLIKRRVLVSGENLTRASVGSDQSGRPAIDFRFDGQGARRFGDATAQNVGRRFAIILDGRVISAPNIISPITGGSGQITGNFTIASASELVNLLNGGALPAPLNVEERRVVTAELGADAVAAGALSTALGFLVIVAFMILSYGFLFGGVSVVGLILNGLLIIAAMSLTQATLTLPGIAGLILTFAVAVDANVLIYERMRDEARQGRSVIASMDAGFNRAMGTIVDANLTTLVAAMIMFMFGAGPVRGFAWTLTIGVFTSVLTAVLVAQVLLGYWLKVAKPKKLPIAE
ncbi:protein translocase subunit SecD [Brevundimonas sp. S30B]|uniref:protein translocase subunit SecD n=1 Tax=unclassified Brevundimonas TaxID=2622653 RepID=UPI00107204B9|nr:MULTISPECIES: protein translocase subunit SecD [unclassified Brevundimonas]QBX37537.1 protein translocase subunit SecD [Brevundimonas sp. MF30-B]TFW03670.1 protein translocase subunit SecD [Brevundimonas sp. S30B]